MRWLALAAAAGCVSPIVVPVQSDLALAPPGTTLDELAAGRALYIRRCAGCHQLAAVAARSPASWERVVEEMSAKVDAPPDELALIRRYLVTTSGR